MSRLSFMKPASKSGVSYGSADWIWVWPREKGYSWDAFSDGALSAEKEPYQEVEHSEELARWHVHVVSKEAVDLLDVMARLSRLNCAYPEMME